MSLVLTYSPSRVRYGQSSPATDALAHALLQMDYEDDESEQDEITTTIPVL